MCFLDQQARWSLLYRDIPPAWNQFYRDPFVKSRFPTFAPPSISQILQKIIPQLFQNFMRKRETFHREIKVGAARSTAFFQVSVSAVVAGKAKV
ncbi:hypothetical protein PsorP6_011616 [Peronosclerospora sorghi]|uniref:Uncharacterized protein n=1 Tax=Peronosclerospora sorghi TaxID=230839 RepID=A0ACC0WMA6_9STRA|nr:hypothetical protein PsorP6_011616 [Peronosclerospora sorghi]